MENKFFTASLRLLSNMLYGNIFDVQYWKLLALDVGTYTPEDINSGGPKGNEIKKTIQQDFTRCKSKKYKKI